MIQSESVNKTKKPGVKLEIMLIHLVQGFPALSFEISSGWPLLLAPISFDSQPPIFLLLMQLGKRPLKSKSSCTYCVMATIHEHTYIYLDITLTPKAHYFLN